MTPALQTVLGGPRAWAETSAYRNAMVIKPPDSYLRAVDRCIATLKSDGTWTRLDALWLLWGHDATAALINAKSPGTFDPTTTGTTTFTAFKGYAGDNSTGNLVGPNIATFGGGFAQDDAALGVAVVTDGQETFTDMQASTRVLLRARSTSDTIVTSLNNSGSTNTTPPAVTAIGVTIMSRDNSANYVVHKDGADLATVVVASALLQSTSLLIARTTNIVGAAIMGKSLNASQRATASRALTDMGRQISAL